MPLHIPTIAIDSAVELFNYDGMFWHTFYESKDWISRAGDGSIIVAPGGMLEYDTGVGDSIAYCYPPYGKYIAAPSWDKVRRLKVACYFRGHTGDKTILDGIQYYVLSGRISNVQPPDMTLEHFGFKCEGDNKLYGTVADGTTESDLDLGVTLIGETPYILEAVFDPDASSVKFYVNNNYKGEIASNLPSGNNLAEYIWYIRTWRPAVTGYSSYYSYFTELRFLQEP